MVQATTSTERAAEYVGAVTADGHWRFGIVVARFNSLVTKQLLEGAYETFHRHGVPSSQIDVRRQAPQ
jgi:6,7-dimethyl-8-ribityllumazine synthase